MATLLQRLGGPEAVSKAVDIFYGKMLSDERVKHFFDGVDMTNQADKQKKFLMMLFGGKNEYAGKNMREAHKPLVARGLNDEHFDITVGHLGDTLKELGAADEDIAEVAGIANSARDDVLNR